MSTTTVPVNEPLHLVAVNIYPDVVLQRNLLHTYKRSGSNYIELENHSESLRNMNGFATPTVIITLITGCNYSYIVQTLTPHYFERHLVDTTVIHGDRHVDTTSLQYMLNRCATMDRATKFIQKARPDYNHLLQDETTVNQETTGGGYCIFFKDERCQNYYHLIRLRHGDRGQASEEGVTTTPTTAWRALQWRVRQATYRLTTLETATTNGQTSVYVWRTLQAQTCSLRHDSLDAYYNGAWPQLQFSEG